MWQSINQWSEEFVHYTVMANLGFTLGIYLLTWGGYFYDACVEVGIESQQALGVIGALLILRQSLVAVLEIPTGAFGDACGHKFSVVMSMYARIAMFAGLVLLTFVSQVWMTYAVLIVVSLAFALFYTLFSGSLLAWLAESLARDGRSAALGGIIARGHTVRLVTTVPGALFGMYAYLQGYAWLAYACAVGTCFATVLLLKHAMRETVPHRSFVSVGSVVERMRTLIADSVQLCRENHLLLTIIILSAVNLTLLTIVNYYWPVAAKALFAVQDQSMQWACFAAMAAVCGAIGARAVSHLLRTDQSQGKMPLLRAYAGLLVVSGVAPFLLRLLLDTAYLQWGFLTVVLCVELANGSSLPLQETLTNQLLGERRCAQRATVMSMASLLRGMTVVVVLLPSSVLLPTEIITLWLWPAGLLLLSLCIGGTLFMSSGLENVERSAA